MQKFGSEGNFQPEWKLWAERGLTKVKIKEKPEPCFLRKYCTIISMYIKYVEYV